MIWGGDAICACSLYQTVRCLHVTTFTSSVPPVGINSSLQRWTNSLWWCMKNIAIIVGAHDSTGGDLIKRGKSTKAVMQVSGIKSAIKTDLCLTSTYHLYCVVSHSCQPPQFLLHFQKLTVSLKKKFINAYNVCICCAALRVTAYLLAWLKVCVNVGDVCISPHLAGLFQRKWASMIIDHLSLGRLQPEWGLANGPKGRHRKSSTTKTHWVCTIHRMLLGQRRKKKIRRQLALKNRKLQGFWFQCVLLNSVWAVWSLAMV